MNLEYISDDLGNKTAVVIPINSWMKILEKFKVVEDEMDDSLKEMSQEEFKEWIKKAETSADMTLEEFDTKWEKKKQQLLNRIP